MPAPVVGSDTTTVEPGEGRATLAVGTVYRGIVPATLELTAGGQCEASFEVGREYLVYATSLQDATTGQVRIAVDGCSRTRLLAAADADLALIKSLNAGRPEGSLYGAIIPSDQIAAVFDDAPVYAVTLQGEGRRLRAQDHRGPLRVQLAEARLVRFEDHARKRLRDEAHGPPRGAGVLRCRVHQRALTHTSPPQSFSGDRVRLPPSPFDGLGVPGCSARHPLPQAPLQRSNTFAGAFMLDRKTVLIKERVGFLKLVDTFDIYDPPLERRSATHAK